MPDANDLPLSRPIRVLPTQLHVVVPSSFVYRVSRAGREPFVPPPWNRVGNNRFDGPRGRFRVVYAASTPTAGFGEVQARFRIDLNELAQVTASEEVDQSDHHSIEVSALTPNTRGSVPSIWPANHQLS